MGGAHRGACLRRGQGEYSFLFRAEFPAKTNEPVINPRLSDLAPHFPWRERVPDFLGTKKRSESLG